MAKKRYYQSRKDRKDERRGMEGYYAGRDDRRRQEHEDSTMIREDRSAIANLPQEYIHREYPRGYFGTEERLDDTIRGIDRQMMDDDREEKREAYPEKY